MLLKSKLTKEIDWRFCFLIIILLIILLIIIYNIFLIDKLSNVVADLINNNSNICTEQDSKNIQNKKFYGIIDNTQYNCIIYYDSNYIPYSYAIIPFGDDISIDNYNVVSDLFSQEFNRCTDVKELIRNVKQYFEINGGKWDTVTESF